MNYSKRILEAVHLMNPGIRLADIGCDHGYMSICAVEQGLFRSAVASDIRSGPLSRAEENIRSAGLEDRIKTVLSDGFRSLQPDFDCAVICGMGGLLIRKILEESPSVWAQADQMILGPHSDTEELRFWILKNTDRAICRESVLKDSGKFYVLLDICPKTQVNTDALEKCMLPEMLRYGNPDIQICPEGYRDHLTDLLEKTERSVCMASRGDSDRSAEKLLELKRDIITINHLLNSDKR